MTTKEEVEEEVQQQAAAAGTTTTKDDDDKATTPSITLSNYGDENQRQHSPWISTLAIMSVYFMYLTSSMLPLLLLVFIIAIIMGWISGLILATIATLVAIDFLIPLPNPYKPNPTTKCYWERMFAEGSQHYFPARSIFVPTNLRKEKAYILAAWPHGLMGGGGHVGFADFSSAERGNYFLYGGASALKYVPFVRRFLYTLGYCDVSKQSLGRVLNVRKHGPTYPYNIVHLVVGGINEMFYTPTADFADQSSKKYETIILDKRKGFIKLALQNQCDIIPMYNFGANQQYQRIFNHNSLAARLSSKLQISLVVWLGRWGIPMGFIPRQQPILGVIGPIFEIPKVDSSEQITDELIQKVHADFVIAMKQLFNKYKIVYVEQMGADPNEWLNKELRLETEI